MKIYYKTVLRGEMAWSPFDQSPEEVFGYRLLDMGEPCCQEMAGAIKAKAITFGDKQEDTSQINQVAFSYCRMPEYYDDSPSWSYYPIKFCPFCGEPVSTEERERVTQKKITHVIPERTIPSFIEVEL